MRLAISGTHRTGKTTLLDALAEQLPSYERIDEPYVLLEEQGHEFSDPPTVEDFERQLRCSLDAIASSRSDALIDRCPLDFVAYLRALDDDYELDDWLPELAAAIAALDLIVVVSIESPDRIAVPSHEDRRLRRKVDALLRDLVLDDPYGLEPAALEVIGDLDARVRQVMRSIRASPR
jgi:predicted ATPase